MSPALLVHIQAYLDEDLSLEGNYLARLRLERAAFRLLIHDMTLLDFALDCGFQNHETFTRAFRRRFGMPPSSYRAWVRTQAQQRPEAAAEQPDDAYSISETKIRRLHRAHLAFIRQVGPYEAVPDTLFDSLEDWATKQGLAGPRIWMGIGQDAPGTTRPEHLRFDAAAGYSSAQAPTDRFASGGNLSDGARECPPAVECDRHLSARGRFRFTTFFSASPAPRIKAARAGIHPRFLLTSLK